MIEMAQQVEAVCASLREFADLPVRSVALA